MSRWRRQASVLTPPPPGGVSEDDCSPRKAQLPLSLPTAHQNRVSAIIFSLAAEWVISTGHDKCVSWMCTRSGSMLGRHFFTSWASCLQYPSDSASPSQDLDFSVFSFELDHQKTEWFLHFSPKIQEFLYLLFFGIK